MSTYTGRLFDRAGEIVKALEQRDRRRANRDQIKRPNNYHVTMKDALLEFVVCNYVVACCRCLNEDRAIYEPVVRESLARILRERPFVLAEIPELQKIRKTLGGQVDVNQRNGG